MTVSLTDPLDVPAWRREQRSELIAARVALARPVHQATQHAIADLLRRHVPEMGVATVAFYWPFRGEVDLRPLVRELIAGGASAALPVVIEKGAPMEFRAWRPGIAMEHGIWNIPVPVERKLVVPDIVLAPLVGFDDAGYRLGYGGGYYDRTLAKLRPQPLTIGVGHDLGGLLSIFPRWHDIRMDAIVTPSGLRWSQPQDNDEAMLAGYASPPCMMHEREPSWFGYLSHRELVEALARLLAACRQMARDVRPGQASQALACCTTAIRAMVLAGGDPVHADERTPACACSNGAAVSADRVDAGRVGARVRELLPRIGNDVVHADLADMAERLQEMAAT